MSHVVLLGDSILDNQAYVSGPDVVQQLREVLPHGWAATLNARDGSVTREVLQQLQKLPAGVTHLVISSGGNDALHQAGILGEGAQSVAEVLDNFAGVSAAFERDYNELLQAALNHNLPTIVCTIYNPRFADAMTQRIAKTALCFFNDVIIRQAISAGAPLLDLRSICNDPNDYANDIEPSMQGGAKISAATVRALQEHDFAARRTQIFV